MKSTNTYRIACARLSNVLFSECFFSKFLAVAVLVMEFPHQVSMCRVRHNGTTSYRRFEAQKIYGKHNTHLIQRVLYKDFTSPSCPALKPCPECGNPITHTDSIIIAVDGGCRGNGTSHAHASIGVFFNYDSKWNISTEVEFDRPTSQRAELRAAVLALEQVVKIQEEAPQRIAQVIVKSDSEYMVKGITEWIIKWKSNGWKTARGTVVQNRSSFRLLDEYVTMLNEDGIEVLFWHVPRDSNQQAHALAEAAFH